MDPGGFGCRPIYGWHQDGLSLFVVSHVFTFFDDFEVKHLTGRGSPNDTWCILESQNWIGTDVYQVDCTANPSDSTCVNNGTGIDPASQRMANLYTDDLVRDLSNSGL